MLTKNYMNFIREKKVYCSLTKYFNYRLSWLCDDMIASSIKPKENKEERYLKFMLEHTDVNILPYKFFTMLKQTDEEIYQCLLKARKHYTKHEHKSFKYWLYIEAIKEWYKWWFWMFNMKLDLYYQDWKFTSDFYNSLDECRKWTMQRRYMDYVLNWWIISYDSFCRNVQKYY